MKLETAYRKLRKHRHRWRLHIETCANPNTVYVYAVMPQMDRDKLPWHLTSDAPNFPRIGVFKRGLANAMNAMADKLDRVELAIQKHNEAQAAIKEAGK